MLIAVINAIVFFLVIQKAQATLEDRNRIFGLLGEKHGGQLVRAKAIFKDVSLALDWEGQPVRLFEGYAAEGPYTEVRVFLGHTNLSGYRFEVHPRVPKERKTLSLASYLKREGDIEQKLKLLPDKGAMAKRFRMEKMTTGDKVFDDHYQITTNDLSETENIFSPKMRHLVSQLQQLGDGGDVHIRLVKYAFNIRKLSRFATAEALGEFHDITSAFSISLFAHLLERKAALSPELIEPAGPEDFKLLPASCDDFPEFPVCLVCGDLVEGESETVRCVTCKAPSHLECWQYIGHCSTYGCTSTKFIKWPREIRKG